MEVIIKILIHFNSFITGPVQPQKKQGGFFSFMSKDKDETSQELNNAYILCYGYIAAYSNPQYYSYSLIIINS